MKLKPLSRETKHAVKTVAAAVMFAATGLVGAGIFVQVDMLGVWTNVDATWYVVGVMTGAMWVMITVIALRFGGDAWAEARALRAERRKKKAAADDTMPPPAESQDEMDAQDASKDDGKVD